MRKFRSIWAYLIAPFPAALLQAIVVALWPKEAGVFAHPASMFVAICIYFYVFGLLLGVPAWLVLRKRNGMGLRTYALFGCVVALLPVILALGWTGFHGQLSAYIVAYNLIFFAIGGTAAGATFWYIAKPRITSAQAT